MITTENKIISRIYGRGRGAAFSASDFTAGFKRGTVDWVLHELVDSGRIRRVSRGIYDYPQYSELLKQELSPDLDQVAHAMARKFNWRILPAGDAALNLLGLSTQVPARLVYLSDGPNRKYVIGKRTLQFRKSATRDVGFRHRESGLVVQALKALGQKRIDDKVIKALRRQLNRTERQRILKDTVAATGWVYEAIKQICKGRG